jgi:hypothetical protein
MFLSDLQFYHLGVQHACSSNNRTLMTDFALRSTSARATQPTEELDERLISLRLTGLGFQVLLFLFLRVHVIERLERVQRSLLGAFTTIRTLLLILLNLSEGLNYRLYRIPYASICQSSQEIGVQLGRKSIASAHCRQELKVLSIIIKNNNRTSSCYGARCSYSYRIDRASYQP